MGDNKVTYPREDSNELFNALADPSRRTLLDALFVRDGQSLQELTALLNMTRFGCMKHLGVLENAGLITTRKAGRKTLHFLNPVPIHLAYERWISKYAQPVALSMAALKHTLEALPPGDIRTMPAHTHVYMTFIKTTPARLWHALTTGDLTQRYYFGTRFESALTPGASYAYVHPDGSDMIRGQIVESDPPRKLVMTFVPLWVPEAQRPEATRVTFEIAPEPEQCKLTLIHEGLDDSELSAGMKEGWARILSGCKSMLEGETVSIN